MSPARALQADSGFVIGRSHQDTAKPCQDYALAGHGGALAWALVSDGCSTGGLTDIGARLWVHAARQVLTAATALPDDLGRLHEQVQAHARPLLQPFAAEDAYATLGLVVGDGERARAALWGDGLVAALSTSGELQCWEVHYALNAPRYPAYDAACDAVAAHLARWQQLVRDSEVCIQHLRCDAAGRVLDQHTGRRAAATHPGLWLAWDDLAPLQALLVCTDGVASTPGRTALDSVRELLQVRNPNGQFLRRRLGALARSWRRNPGQAQAPVDDLGAAALWWSDRP